MDSSSLLLGIILCIVLCIICCSCSSFFKKIMNKLENFEDDKNKKYDIIDCDFCKDP